VPDRVAGYSRRTVRDEQRHAPTSRRAIVEIHGLLDEQALEAMI
jgi:hypothetical protein